MIKALSRTKQKALRFCFTIPASPTDGFYSQVAMFRVALNKLGMNYKNADIFLLLGDETIKELPERWSHAFGDGVKISWSNPAYYEKVGIYAQGEDRWRQDYDDYDVVVFSDADTILLEPIDELLVNVYKHNSVAGVIAHYPFPHHEDEKSNDLWHFYANKFTGKDIQLSYKYTLLNPNKYDESTKCPFYVNFGFVAMTPQVYRTIRETHLNIYSTIIPFLINPMFCGQIALTLAIHEHQIPTISVPMKYNFPNDPVADELYPDQMRSISVIHYLRTDKFDRQKIFVSQREFEAFLSLELDGSNKIFQNFIQKLTQGKYPFP